MLWSQDISDLCFDDTLVCIPTPLKHGIEFVKREEKLAIID
ncbi:MAG: hypothetical protein ACI8RD_008743 [Bacillariaceae sp.]|jgi:hypothetical protein